MKFTFDRDSMIKEISIAQEIITNKSPISILSNILLIAENNSLTIKATDSTVKFTTVIPIDIEEEGRTTIFCDKFMSILSSLPSGDIEFIQEDIGVIIKPISKKIKFQLKSQASDKFPEIGTSENVPFFEISSKDFKEMIKETIFAVSDDRNKYFMSGVYFIKKDDTLTMVATDGRRLSCDTKHGVSVPDFQPAIIPTKILSCILKHAPEEGNIQVAVIDKSIFVKFSNIEFSSVLIEGQFPNYQKVIPESLKMSFMVNKADLDSALKRTTIMVDKKVSRIIFKISSGVLKIISPESDIGTADEEIPCRYDGQDISMAMNFTYITDPLKVIDSENVVFDFNINEVKGDEEANITKAVIMRAEPSSDYIHVIMPMSY
ncbi:MAG: DNA polymerase III subunit beta [Treponema sp.]|uniref:DNA polymerase III subunit beta n=1 Tax=Treponema sp. TaxID=166 RepID=UPI00298DFAA4|nr:DNA polymerase III subunit beta [Treponema sp.]MCQ2601429.1 DNA polymerase III subunit beta [Treponema sp.]